jgi:hypothetical protein
VYALVKDFMASTTLRQAPVMVLPADRYTVTSLPTQVAGRSPLSAETVKNYSKLILKCREYDMGRAADSLHSLLFDLSYRLPALGWLADPALRFRWTKIPLSSTCGVANPYFAHLPDTFNMVAKNGNPLKKAKKSRKEK